MRANRAMIAIQGKGEVFEGNDCLPDDLEGYLQEELLVLDSPELLPTAS